MSGKLEELQRGMGWGRGGLKSYGLGVASHFEEVETLPVWYTLAFDLYLPVTKVECGPYAVCLFF